MTAVQALGSPWGWPPEDVQVFLPHARRVRARRGLRISGESLEPSEVIPTAWGPATSPARTAFDLARRASGASPWRLAEAVARVDSVLHVSGASVQDVRAVAAAHPGIRGARIARRVLDLAEPLAESPQESRLRVHIVLAGLPRPIVQFEITDALGRVVYRLDLAWPELRCAAEYDGQQHRLDDRQYRHDIDRYNDLTSSWTIRRVIAEHMRSMPRLLAGIDGMLRAGTR
jgi:very-short-patch-repair endonuclease